MALVLKHCLFIDNKPIETIQDSSSKLALKQGTC